MYTKGQKLICISDIDVWFEVKTGTQFDGPKCGEIVTYLRYKEGYLAFEEYNYSYKSCFFRPLLGKSAVKELAVFTNIVETSDCPIIQPQTIEQ